MNEIRLLVEEVAQLNMPLHRSFFTPGLTIETIFILRDTRPALTGMPHSSTPASTFCKNGAYPKICIGPGLIQILSSLLITANAYSHRFCYRVKTAGRTALSCRSARQPRRPTEHSCRCAHHPPRPHRNRSGLSSRHHPTPGLSTTALPSPR